MRSMNRGRANAATLVIALGLLVGAGIYFLSYSNTFWEMQDHTVITPASGGQNAKDVATETISVKTNTTIVWHDMSQWKTSGAEGASGDEEPAGSS